MVNSRKERLLGRVYGKTLKEVGRSSMLEQLFSKKRCENQLSMGRSPLKEAFPLPLKVTSAKNAIVADLWEVWMSIADVVQKASSGLKDGMITLFTELNHFVEVQAIGIDS